MSWRDALERLLWRVHLDFWYPRNPNWRASTRRGADGKMRGYMHIDHPLPNLPA